MAVILSGCDADNPFASQDCTKGFGFLKLTNKTGQTATLTVDDRNVANLGNGKTWQSQVDVGMHTFRFEGCYERSAYVDTCEIEAWSCGN
jgi:hypothetical protein